MLYNTTKGYLGEQFMDYDETPVSPRYSTTIRFVAIAAVLVILLILGLVFSKRIVANMTDEPSKTASTTTSDKEAAEKKAAEQEKQAATNKATQQEQQKEQAAKEKEAEAAKQAEADKKKAEEKKAKEAAAAQQAASQAAAAPSVASTGPGAVASTGPEDAIPYTFAVAALGYAVATFVRSRQTAQE